VTSPQPQDLRNLGLVGHRGVGKTSLNEALLHTAGAIDQLGSVDNGTAVADFEPEEQERNISITAALCHCEHNGVKLNLLDTPGYSEFFVDALYCLWVVENALLVLDAASGVEVHTIKMYDAARSMGVPVIGVVNKMDAERADLASVVQAMNDDLTECEAVAVQLPIGTGAGFEGVVDLLSERAIVGAGADARITDLPAEMSDQVAAARDALMDAVAATDDDLTMKYLEDGALTQEEFTGGLRAAVASRALIPVLCTAATSEVGVKALLDFLADVALSPADAEPWAAHPPDSEEEVSLEADPAAAATVVVFKTLSDPYVGKFSLMRVVSGTVKADQDVTSVQSKKRERLSGLAINQGRETENVAELVAGDLGSAMRLEQTATGDTLTAQGAQVVVDTPEVPDSMYAAAANAASRADADKLSDALAKLAAEDMAFSYERSNETGELLVKGMGPLHLDVVLARLRRQFEVAVQLSEPRVPYKETVRTSVRVQGRHKKQTGGRGQFGDVWIRVEPLARGEGFEFVNEVRGGSVPTNFIPAVQKGIVDAMQSGRLAGYPVVDVRVTLDDGSSHPVDSSDIAFRTAGSIALRSALEQADPVLLEPIMAVTVALPEDIMGDVMSDLNSKRGRILGTEQAGSMQVIRSQVPQAELGRYAADLRSLSQGRASFELEFSHYEEVPGHLAGKVMAEAQAAKEAEEA
jgi:elongation factor G